MNMPIVKRVEIAFWDFAIQTLSENETLRNLIRRVYATARQINLPRTASLLAITALSGLFTGMILGVVTAMLR